LVELARWQARFAELGIAVAAMSYDSRAVLAAFHRAEDLPYPLLRDADARHVRAYGVLNPQYQPGDRAYGIPLPGVLFVTPEGRVAAKFAEPNYRERPAMAEIRSDLAARVGDSHGGG
jgi:peroxiredoxin